MTGVLQKIGWRAEALAWDGYQSLFRSFGLERASAAGAGLLKTLGPLASVHHVARVNMRIAFPHAHEREIDALLERMWDNFGRLAGEFPNTHRFDMSPNSADITVVGSEILDELARTGQPAVLVSGHFANWELLGAVIMQHLPRCRVTYRHANNPIIDRRITAQRAAYGVRVFAPKGEQGAKEIMKALKAGASVGLMNDQKMNDGIAAPFFGVPAMTASGPARLALRYDAPIVPMSVRRVDGPRFTVTVHEPLARPKAQDRTEAVFETVCRINAFLEDRIREAPAQWFWVHRRFDKAIYKPGAALPVQSASAAGSTPSVSPGSI
ncbi:MAG: lysophospholipid acyltransferase family protein [Pseudomonadota bacterium]